MVPLVSGGVGLVLHGAVGVEPVVHGDVGLHRGHRALVLHVVVVLHDAA